MWNGHRWQGPSSWWNSSSANGSEWWQSSWSSSSGWQDWSGNADGDEQGKTSLDEAVETHASPCEDLPRFLRESLTRIGLEVGTYVTPLTDESLFKVVENDSSSISARFTAEVTQPLHSNVGLVLPSGCAATIEQAKCVAAKNALYILEKERLRAVDCDLGMADYDSSKTCFEWPFVLPLESAVQLSNGIDSARGLFIYTLELAHAEDQACEFAFLSTFSSKYAFRIEAESVCVGIRCREEGISLSPDQVEIVLKFHNDILFDESEQLGAPAVAVVRITSTGELDWDAMEGAEQLASFWLPALWRRTVRLQEMELALPYAPIGPFPSPLKLEVVADMGRNYQGLRLLGQTILEMLGALTVYIESPAHGPELLRQKLAALIGAERCKALVHTSTNFQTFLQAMSVCSISEDLAVGHLAALLGIFACEDDGGDLFSVCKCWEWLVGWDQFTKALAYANYQLKRKGRTPDMQFFRQMTIKSMLTLQVYYTEYGFVYYQRPHVEGNVESYGVGFEMHGSPEDDNWMPLQWDLKECRIHSSRLGSPLPNKVGMWLRGSELGKFVPSKRKKQKSVSNPLTLLEKRHGKDTCLVVRLQGDASSTFYYYSKGEQGGLGLQATDEGRQWDHLFYSEMKKTLISPWNPEMQQPIPELVVDWILNRKSLVQMILPDVDPHPEVEPKIDQENRWVTWSARNCRYRSFLDEVPHGFLLMMEDIDGRQCEELEFDCERKCWVRPCDQQPLPSKVLKQLQHWVEAPLKQRAQTLAAKLETLFLAHDFTKPALLLLEALWYPSLEMQRLTFVGSHVFEALVVKVLLSRARFLTTERYGESPDIVTWAVETGEALKADALRDDAISSREFDDGLLSISVKDCEELQSLVEILCSHISCGVTSVRLGLDIISKNESACVSPQFRNDVDRFARIARKAIINNERKGIDDWAKVLAAGAPKALGDALHAVVGATVLDQGGLEDALSIVREHVAFCSSLCQVKHESSNAKKIPIIGANLISALPKSGIALNSAVLGSSNPTSAMQGIEEFSDACICDVGAVTILDSSPRSLNLRAPYIQEDWQSLLVDDLEKPEPPEELEPVVSGKAVWCKVCKMLLNSREQFDGPDGHVHGKKHKINLSKMNNARGRVGEVVDKAQTAAQTGPRGHSKDMEIVETDDEYYMGETTQAYVDPMHHMQAYANANGTTSGQNPGWHDNYGWHANYGCGDPWRYQ